MRATAIIFLVMLASCVRVKANTTNYAASGSSTDVQTAINLCVNGDAVVVPPGTNTWTVHVTITNGIFLVATGAPGTTVVYDNLPDGLNAFNQNLMYLSTVSNQTYQVSGFWILTNNPTRSSVYAKGVIQAVGFGGVRIDHNLIQGPMNNYIFIGDQLSGVADHNTFIITAHQHCFSMNGDQWGGTNYQNGDGSWFLAPNYGSTNGVFYIEDNFFTNNFTVNAAFIDCFTGARFVFRNNTLYDDFLSWHGTESGQRQRSPRQFEVYSNSIVRHTWKTLTKHAMNVRGGTGVIYSNVISGFDDAFGLSLFRAQHGFTSHWGGANGINSWDSNSVTVYWTGTHDGTNNSFLDAQKTIPLLTNNGAAWTPNQWQGYMLLDTNTVISVDSATSPNQNNYSFGYVYSNTANILFLASDATGIAVDATVHPTNSSFYELHLVYQVMDAPGSGQDGVLLTGNSGETPQWLNQSVEEVYGWSNTWSDTTIAKVFALQNLQLVEGKDFTNGVPKPSYTAFAYPHPYVGGTPAQQGPTFLVQPQPVVSFVGNPTTFSALADGATPMTSQWWYATGPKAVGPLTTNTTSSLSVTFTPQTLNEVGNYYAVVTNANGNVQSINAALVLVPINLSLK